jgi:hypothetical protein
MKKRTFHIALAAALFGALVWLSVNLSDDYQVTLTAPLSIQGVPPGSAIRTPVPRTLQMKFRGRGWRLAAMLLGPDIKLVFPFATLPGARSRAESGTDRAITLSDIADRVVARPGVQLVDVKPDSVFISLDRYVQKQVPVVMDAGTTFREGYGQVGAATVTPESVTIGGAESVVKDVASWPTVKYLFEDLRAPVEDDLPLADAGVHDFRFSVPRVHVSINVQPFAEKLLSGLPVEILETPSNREVILIPPRIEIVARGGIKQLSGLGPGDFRVTVDYTYILSDTTGNIDALIAGPSGIQIVRKRPEHLQYIVRKRL